MIDSRILFVGDDAWRLGRVRDGEVGVEDLPFAKGVTLAVRIEELKHKLEASGYQGEPLILALASAWCLSAPISTEDLARSGRRSALGFRLEEQLPVSAEDAVADYVEGRAGAALGVCCELAPLQAVVEGLESSGVTVGRICPAAFLAAARAAAEFPQAQGVLIQSQGGGAADAFASSDLIELENGTPTRWWWIPDPGPDGAAIRHQLAAWVAPREKPVRLAVIGPAPSERDGQEPVPGLEQLASSASSGDQAAALEAARILGDSASPWIDLRRDRLGPPDPWRTYRRSSGILAAAASWMMIGILVVTQWRARQYETLSRDYAQQEVEVFKAALPNQRVPGNVRARLLSEQQKLEALSGRTIGAAGSAALNGPSALAHLTAVLAGLPTDLRYRILEMNISPDLIRVDGQVLSHADAERLSAGLRASGNYEVDAPTTHALKDGSVSFWYTAKPRSGAPKPGGGE